ncbi:hypothetical protein FKV75_02290 [Weissella paramesenteroides]|uniref:hypothetical protein n=1 Tax=Weissella paramesenteroides TaxID=1249 RepID=UPI001238467F|nr:hypothetical protein [Weissella paramesenteroides]KAA8439121.1 hypothetical protein FKV81_08545 [Weissella paramesenteroides]KAA8440171.1 hypothetical protein FKV77_08910 [Weissella paramesenteroides]KAA8443918.1 hypothetical protein FKV75_02290 [Weissella paramesenteroides]KAA8446399.1 hypothetical protein FKV76_05900 [Weissella paramesenteroides]KAA8451469.1 hypothetical protein FKV74_02290 [Weissella paramesenteroides]
MKNIADLQALIIDLTSDKARTVVESETDTQALIFSLILLGYSQNKDSAKLDELFVALDANYDSSDDDIISNLSDLITDIF